MASMEAIRCEGLTKHFGRFAALSDLDITVEQGTTYGFLGPNGAGKTTTLRLLTGITTPSNGRMWVANEEVSGDSLHLKSLVGYLPESPSFYGWMTGREFLMFVGDLYEMEPSEARHRADEMLGSGQPGRRRGPEGQRVFAGDAAEAGIGPVVDPRP